MADDVRSAVQSLAGLEARRTDYSKRFKAWGGKNSQRRRPMTEEELRDLCSQKLLYAVGGKYTTHAQVRIDLLREYLGLPYGNEMEGFAQYIDRTCMDVVEETLPTLMKVFHGSDEPVQFEARGQGKDDVADQATTLANLCYTIDNPGFHISQEVLKDACTQGLGIWKVEWREERKCDRRAFSGLTEEEVDALELIDGVELEIVEPDEEAPGSVLMTREIQELMVQQGVEDPAEIADQLPRIQLYKGYARRYWTHGFVHVDSVAPEDFRYENGSYRADKCAFFADVELRHKQDLIAEGMNAEMVMGLPGYTIRHDTAEENDLRRSEDVSLSRAQDETMELVEIAYCYIRIDFDGDGVAEWRRVVLAGNVHHVLISQEMVDDHAYIPVSPIIMPHALEGFAVPQQVNDLQRVNTEIIRQMLDGLFESNNQRFKVLKNSPAWASLLNPAPGKPVAVNGQEDVMPLVSGWEPTNALAMLDWTQKTRERRSGLSAARAGLDPDLLKQKTLGATREIMSASQERTELVVRNFAEMGFGPLWRKINGLNVRHQDKPRVEKMGENWVEMNPSSWDADMPIKANVGLGTGDQSMQLSVMEKFLGLQLAAIEKNSAMVDESNVYALLKDMSRVAHMKGFPRYFKDPKSPQAMEEAQANQADPANDPLVLAATESERIKAESAERREQMKADLKRDEMDQNAVFKAAEIAGRFGLGVGWADLQRRQRTARNDDGDLQAPIEMGLPFEPEAAPLN